MKLFDKITRAIGVLLFGGWRLLGVILYIKAMCDFVIAMI